MKLDFLQSDKSQPDPYVFFDNGRYYIYATAKDGVAAYSSDSLMGQWKFEGYVCSVEGRTDYWAPCIILIDGIYYIYFSCREDWPEELYVASSRSPLGPFDNAKKLYERFTIDPHVVKNESGLFLFYAEDNILPDKRGTRIFVDKLIDPETPANICKEIICPSFDEEIFERNRSDGKDWYTLEGPFYIKEGNRHYVMYSGGCYKNDTYHVGYAVATSDETDLTELDFVKHSDNGRFAPVLFKNDVEEGTGHHSVIKTDDGYFAIYHGRDIVTDDTKLPRTARICRLQIEDGIIKVTDR